jgi:hypothetical protein
MVKRIHPSLAQIPIREEKKEEKYSDRKCADCDRLLTEDEAERGYTNTADELICEGCDESYRCCVACENKVHEDDTYWGDDEPYCERCFYDRFDYCAGCDETYNNEETTYIENIGSLCDDCYNNDGYFYCSYCSEHYHPEDKSDKEDKYGDPVCKNCADSEPYNFHKNHPRFTLLKKPYVK